MKQQIAIVNASPVLSDREVAAVIPAMQTQIDRDFMPYWHGYAVDAELIFMPWRDFGSKPVDVWPVFINRHSKDESMLGYHTVETEHGVYSRVFAGDVMRMQLEWTVTLSHELLEILADPGADRVFQMADGRYAAVEVCDPVEADDQAYLIDGVLVSNFVLPAYFSSLIRGGQYDFGGYLDKACPELTPGGYISIVDSAGNWSNIHASKSDGMLSRRAILNGYRRAKRARTKPATTVVMVGTRP